MKIHVFVGSCLVQGYGGGDEVKMLQRQLRGTSARIGVGANRVATAVRFLEQYGFKSSRATFGDRLFSEDGSESRNDQIGVAILDDGMQVNTCFFLESCIVAQLSCKEQ